MTHAQADLVPYSGEWVALVDGQVVAAAPSPEAAERLARRAWPQAALELVLAPPIAIAAELPLPPLLAELQPLLAGAPVWLVGGAVRDRLLGRPLHDLDFAVDGDGLTLARRVANRLQAAFFPLDPVRGTGRVVIQRPGGDPLLIDFARLRGSGGPDAGALAALQVDLAYRDFTINAMALPAAATSADELIDPLGGRDDLLARRIRATRPEAVRADPNRALRALRQAAELRFTIDPGTLELLRADGPAIVQIAAERRTYEFVRLLCAPGASGALRELDGLGLLELLVPEVTAMRGLAQGEPHYEDVLSHTFTAVDRLDAVLATLGIAPARADPLGQDDALAQVAETLRPYAAALVGHLGAIVADTRTRRMLLPLAALLHDCGKPLTAGEHPETGRRWFPQHDLRGAELAAARARALRLSAAEATWLATVVRGHMLDGWHAGYDAVGAYRFFRGFGPAGIDAALLSIADQLAAHARYPRLQERLARKLQSAVQLCEAYFRQHARIVAPPALISGHDLIVRLKLRPGPQVGALLERLREAQVAGEVSDRDQALALARQMAAEMGEPAAGA
jgi:tRNA nucleotidyltransferase/poly(A) polymerase